MTLHEFSADYAPAIQAVAALVGLASLLLLWLQIRKTNDWNRVSAAFQIMELERFYRLEEQATKDCKTIGVPFPAALSFEQAQKIRSQYDAYHAVKNLVIFLDRISVAYQAGYIDKDVVTFTYGPLISGYYKYLDAYISLTRSEMQAPELYRDFKRTADDVALKLEKCRRKLQDTERAADGHGGIGGRL